MFAELMATHFVLQKWKQNPLATKQEIGVWLHWCEPTEQNRKPLSAAEVTRMKRFLKRNAPSSYAVLFPESKSLR
jgi:hypothetical protein